MDANIGFKFKHDYTIIDLPREVVVLVSNNEQKIMRFNEIYKFSDGTLTNIMEALDYRVKEYKVNRLNPGELYQKDRRDLPRDNLLVSVEVLRQKRKKWNDDLFSCQRSLLGFRSVERQEDVTDMIVQDIRTSLFNWIFILMNVSKMVQFHELELDIQEHHLSPNDDATDTCHSRSKRIDEMMFPQREEVGLFWTIP
ncbi:hypothetical protein Tco_0262381 [Tanacetum coccineum]